MTSMNIPGKRKLELNSLLKLLAALILAAAIVVFTYCASFAHVQEIFEAKDSSDIFRTFELDTLDGGKMNASELRNSRLVVVNIWGTDCPPCIKELPELAALSNEYDPKDLRVIGIPRDVDPAGKSTFETRLAEARRIISVTGVTFTNLIPDAEMEDFIKASVIGTPTTFLLDQEGNVIETMIGGKPISVLKSLIGEHLGGN